MRGAGFEAPLVGILAAFLTACGGTIVDTGQRTEGGGAGGSGAQAGGGTGGAATGGGSTGTAGTSSGAGGAAGAGLPPCQPAKVGADNDGDGFAQPEDCNDNDRLVNPGAFELVGDAVDNNCDGAVDEVISGCDDASDVIAFDTQDARALARAMGVCGPSSGGRSWGVLDARVEAFSGTFTGAPLQYGVQSPTAPEFAPRQGRSVLMLSTRSARFYPQPGWDGPVADLGRTDFPPPGFPYPDEVCKASNPNVAWEPISLRIRFRTPTNAARASFKVAFGAEHYDLATCNDANDAFAVFMRETALGVGSNHATLADGRPISVDTAPFSFCQPTSFQVGGETKKYACAGGLSAPADRGVYSTDGFAAWTDWVTVTVPVLAGVESELVISVWGAGFSQSFSSAVLVDGWQWEAPAKLPVSCTP